jgi:aspartate/methionine/tyrosine aminotransferase
MRFPASDYLEWAKALPPAQINLARSGIEPCPPSLLQLRPGDLVINLPVKYGYAPLRDRIAGRYHVNSSQVFTVSGGTSFANYLAYATALDGCGPGSEIIVERPAYEPLVRLPVAFGHRVRRLDRRLAEAYAIDLDRFDALITPRTKLAIVTNLHNPSGARIPPPTLSRMAERLAQVGAHLLVDEVYLECLFARGTESSVHAGGNVIVTNSLTKAYGLDGLRAGWILGPHELITRASRINNLMTNNGVAPGERLALKAFRRISALQRRSHSILDPNLAAVEAFLDRERRLEAFVPEGGNVIFPRLPAGIESQALSQHLLEAYSTAVVPGRFFESPDHIRLSFGCAPTRLARGLANISRALDDLLR